MLNFKIPVTYKDIIKSAGSSVKKALVKLAEASQNKKPEDEDNDSGGGKTGYEALAKEFEEIDKKYNYSSDGLGLEKLVYDAPTDSEIEAAAKDELRGKYENGKDEIVNSIDREADSLSDEKNAVSDNLDEGLKTIDAYYGERKKEAENDALRRGLARSSIITGKIEEFDREKIGGKSGLLQDAREQLLSLDSQIKALEGKKESALSKYEISYAAELSGKINSLKEKREEKLEEALKYNNSVKEKEIKYADSKKSDGTNDGSDLYRKEEKLAAAKKYYDLMGKEEALNEFLNEPAIKSQLGEYYAYMLNYLKNRTK